MIVVIHIPPWDGISTPPLSRNFPISLLELIGQAWGRQMVPTGPHILLSNSITLKCLPSTWHSVVPPSIEILWLHSRAIFGHSASKSRDGYSGFQATRIPFRGHTLGLVTIVCFSFGSESMMFGGAMVSELSRCGVFRPMGKDVKVDNWAEGRLGERIPEQFTRQGMLIVRDAKAQIILTSDLASYFLLRRNSRSKYRYSTASPALILLWSDTVPNSASILSRCSWKLSSLISCMTLVLGFLLSWTFRQWSSPRNCEDAQSPSKTPSVME